MNASRLRSICHGLRRFPLAMLGLWLLSGQSQVVAENIIFTIDPSQSTQSITGTDNTYGAFGPSSTASASLSGHFMVSFDPTTDTPSSVQFQGSSGGFYTLSTPYTLLPGIGGTGPAAPANLGGSAGPVSFALRNLTYDVNSSPLSPTSTFGSSSTFAATSTNFQVLSGGFDYINPGPGNVPETGATGAFTAGTWTLTDSPANSGDWTLALSAGSVPIPYNATASGGTSGLLTATVNVVSTAQFGANNVATVPSSPSTPTTVDVLGGSSSTGGVSVTLPANTVGGPLVVQSVANSGALTQQEISAAASNPVFAASLYDSSTQQTQPIQAWIVSYPPELAAGQTATVVFHYDPSLLPANTDYSELGIWHYSTVTDSWNFGGTVNTSNDTITYVTDSFSPFVVGTPEPSTFVLLIVGTIGLAVAALRRRRRSRS